jgi:serine/threonine protein kinase
LFYSIQLSLALEACHAHEYVYRDVKLSNVLLHSSGNIKLSDFGFAKLVKWRDTTTTYCGTPHAMAPEIILKNKYDRRVDWFSFGVLVYELMMGAPPTGYQCEDAEREASILSGHSSAVFPSEIFDDASNGETINEGKKNDVSSYSSSSSSLSSSSSSSFSSPAIDFIRQCWSVDPGTRLGGGMEQGAKEIHAHPWMFNIVEEVRHGILPPPRPNSAYFSYNMDDYDGREKNSSTLTKEEQNMFVDF